MNKLTIVTAQFPVTGSFSRNFYYMVKLATQAKNKKADLIHFSETCLGGYAGAEFENWDKYDWNLQEKFEREIFKLAENLNLGIIYGSNHRISGEDIRNSLKYVSGKGELVERYDKRFCTPEDLKYYKSGNRFVNFEINGFNCGMLICYDVRFPELYREYKKLGTQILFQSFYNARAEKRNIHSIIMRPSAQVRAATNYFYISVSNSSGYYQSWPSAFILPDGSIASSCTQHKTGIIINTVSENDKYYDASSPFRDRAMSGILNSV